MSSTQTKFTIGRAELEILNYIHDHHPITVRQVAEQYGEGRGLVRTTVLNVMERLRKKGCLLRKQSDGLFYYSPKQAKADLLRNLVKEFVEKSLGGSLSPFVAYLADEAKLTKSEIGELKQIVRDLEKNEP